jgi:hypothetical protein
VRDTYRGLFALPLCGQLSFWLTYIIAPGLLDAGRQVGRCVADSSGATEYDNVGGAKTAQFRKGRGRNAVLGGNGEKTVSVLRSAGPIGL